MSAKLLNLVAIVTGGAQGIGREVARALLSEQCRVVIVDIDEEKGEEFVNEIGDDDACRFMKCDVRDSDALRTTFDAAKAWGGDRLDIVINNARASSENSSGARDVIMTNLIASVEATYKAIELMGKTHGAKHKGGVVINVASMNGLKIEKVSAFHTASETGIVNFTRSFKEWNYFEDDGVRVNCVCPSTISDGTGDVRSASERRNSSQDFIKREGTVRMKTVVNAFMNIIMGSMNAKIKAILPPDQIDDA